MQPGPINDENWETSQFQDNPNVENNAGALQVEDKKPELKEKKTRPMTPMVCRICLGDNFDNEEQDNPLISVCNCVGSISQIHWKCLTMWLNQKRETRNAESTRSYQWQVLECELCSAKFPDFVYHNGKKYKIYEYDEPDERTQQYVVFQSIYSQKKVKTIHVVSTPKGHITRVVRLIV